MRNLEIIFWLVIGFLFGVLATIDFLKHLVIVGQ